MITEYDCKISDGHMYGRNDSCVEENESLSSRNSLLTFLVLQCSDARNFVIDSSSRSGKLSIEALMEEIQQVVSEKVDYENPDESVDMHLKASSGRKQTLLFKKLFTSQSLSIDALLERTLLVALNESDFENRN